MKLLITGAHGQVGWELTQQIKNSIHESLGFNHSELDITDSDKIHKLIQRAKPDMLINAAAYTAVDKAEQEHELAFKVNTHGPLALAQACAKANIPLIHLSTDYIFAGQKQQPYTEDDQPEPLNIYGQSKLKGEEAVMKYCDKHLILRVSGVFGSHGNNFVKTMLRLAHEKEQLNVVSDQILCPTWSADIAQVILQVCERLTDQNYGVYHYCGKNPVSWHQFTQEIINLAKTKQLPIKVKELKPISSIEYSAAAKRPAYSVLDCKKIFSNFDIQQADWQTGLKQVLNEIYA